jgi:hypothetical protein
MMGTYDNAFGGALHDPMFDEEEGCEVCMQYVDDCTCPVCPGLPRLAHPAARPSNYGVTPLKPYDQLLGWQQHRFALVASSLYDHGDLMLMRSSFPDWAQHRAVQARALEVLGPKPWSPMLFELYDRLMSVDAIRKYVLGDNQ